MPSFLQHDLHLVVFGTLFGHLISVMSLQDKFASLWQVNNPNSQNKFQIIMVYRNVFDMTAIAFRGILCVFVNSQDFARPRKLSEPREYSQDWEQFHQNVPGVPRHCTF